MVNESTSKNRDKFPKAFYSRACRARYHKIAKQVGREILERHGMAAAQLALAAVERAALAPVRRKRQEYVDLDRMSPQERLGALCRAAERWGVIKSRLKTEG